MEGHEEVCYDEKKPNDCNYCGKMEADWQVDEKESGTYAYDDSDEEWDQGDDDSCCFPDKLNKRSIKSPERFEMFMRVTESKDSPDSKVLFEGFIPQEQVRSVARRNGNVGLDINFRGMEFPKWHEMDRSLFLDIQKDRLEWLKSTSHIPYITLLAMPKKLDYKKMSSVNSLSTALVGCFGRANLKESDELDDDHEEGLTHFDGFDFDNDIYHIRFGSVAAANPHTGGPGEEYPCRYMYLAWSKESVQFAGIRIEDWNCPTAIDSYGVNSFYWASHNNV
jgi:hypothetical protein